MNKKNFTVSDFRKVLEQMVQGDRVHFSFGKNGGFLETLDTMEQMTDEELLEAKLYTDLGLDSIDVWEMICFFERDNDVSITDDVELDLGTGVSVTVKSFLKAVNKHQE